MMQIIAALGLAAIAIAMMKALYDADKRLIKHIQDTAPLPQNVKDAFIRTVKNKNMAYSLRAYYDFKMLSTLGAICVWCGRDNDKPRGKAWLCPECNRKRKAGEI